MSEQIPLCMIGDSITWATHGDCWRQELIRRIPRLAFVGTHVGVHGYSHAGEGGNSTVQVLARLDAVPDSAHYALLIGTNDLGYQDPGGQQAGVARTVANIERIVARLLARPATRTVFLGSILPCDSDGPEYPVQPLRDATNQLVNAALRARLGGDTLPTGRVAWVEYEHRLRPRPDWPAIIRLHPLPEGYAVLADILAEAIAQRLGLSDPSAVWRPEVGSGVEVVNLLDQSTRRTREPVIAGWYSLSCMVEAVDAEPAAVTVRCGQEAVGTAMPVARADAGRRLSAEIFTGYEGYGYTRGVLEVVATGCRISRILVEKRRPGGLVSTFGDGVYVDSSHMPAAGELITPRPS